jgi:hypothetical protein
VLIFHRNVSMEGKKERGEGWLATSRFSGMEEEMTKASWPGFEGQRANN